MRKSLFCLAGLAAFSAAAGTFPFNEKIEACAAAGGGRVVVPAGEWTTGAIRLRSNVELHLEEGATVIFSDKLEDHLPAVRNTYEGIECWSYSSHIYAFGETNVAVTGKGVLKTLKPSWSWEHYKAHRDDADFRQLAEACTQLRQWGADGVPVDERQFWKIAGPRARMQFIHFERCQGVRLEGFRIVGSPMWTVHLYRCADVVARGLDIMARGLNTDGFDIEMTRDVLIEDCTLDQQDDGFTIKAGKDAAGRAIGVPTENVLVRNCHVKNAHGLLVIGSEVSAGVRNVRLENCTADVVINGCYLKTNPHRGGFIEDVWFENVTCSNAHHSAFAIETDVTYGQKPLPGTEECLTRIRGVHVRNADFRKASRRLKLVGDARLPIEDVTVDNLRVGFVRRAETNLVKNVKGLVVDGRAALCLAGAVNFNFGWQWRFEGESSWRDVDLPHDFLINEPWDKSAVHSQRVFKDVNRTARYRKDFAFDPSWGGRRVILDFGGVQFFGDVFLNGAKVASTEYGALGIEVDVTDALRREEANRIEVTAGVRGGPDGCRWYTGGGLCRDVTLKVVGERRVARHGVCVRTRENRFVDIEVEVLGCTDLKDDVEVRAELDGQVVTAPVPKGDMRRRVPVKLPRVTLAAPRLWSVEAPNLYELKVKVADDVRTHRFGVRTIEFDKSFGFRLNGKKVFLKGISNHGDFGALGVAAYRDAIARQFRLMREFGYNAVRCSHNPYPEDFYALADEMGLLVVDELTDKWCGSWAGRKPFLEMWEELLTEWVRRDRNHPSVILWSLGNELQHEERPSGLETGDWGVTQYRMMDVLTKHWDPTRPTTVANFPSRAGGIVRRDPRFREKAWMRAPELARVTEVASFNYRPEDYATYLSFDPDLNIFQSEASTSRWLEPYDLMDRERMTGLCYWGAIEYWGESNAYPKKGWNFSFFSHALRPYPQAYLIRSAFSDEPVVRLGVVGRSESLEWNDVKSGAVRLEENWNRADGDRVTVLAFSNAPEVELLLNGRSLGKVRTDGHVAKFENVIWEPGELKAVASNGATHAIRTAGPVARIRLTAETEGPMRADGQSLKYVWIEAVDRDGTVVPNATDEVSVRVSGAAKLLAIDEDDHYTEQRFDVDRKRLNGGRLLAIVRAGRSPGRAVLEANGERLEWDVDFIERTNGRRDR